MESKKEGYKERKKNKDKTYYQNHKDTIAICNSNYRKNNRDKINKNRRFKIKVDVEFKLKENVRNLVKVYLKRGNISKNNPVFLSLNYSVQELKQHLESQFEPWMTWANWGRYNSKTWNDNDPTTWTWQIDHIIPHSIFKYDSIQDTEFKKAWALNNLRPYSSKLNSVDGSKRTRHNKKGKL